MRIASFMWGEFLIPCPDVGLHGLVRRRVHYEGDFNFMGKI